MAYGTRNCLDWDAAPLRRLRGSVQPGDAGGIVISAQAVLGRLVATEQFYDANGLK